uniref:SfiI-subtelomeric related protein family member, putative n=1 Tax=Theileria annulata TaxID=5874 RepID=A0A3B0NB52_THEAN
MKITRIYKFILQFILVYKCITVVYCSDRAGEGATSGLIPVTLNISSAATIEIDHYKEGENFRTFKARPGYNIKKIIKKNVKIWTAQPEDNALKAVLMGSGKEPKYLGILLQSGKFALLRKFEKGKPYEDITHTRTDMSKVKMFNRTGEEIDSTQYIVDMLGLYFVYEFKDGLNCHKILYSDRVVYEYELNPEFGLLKGVYLDLFTNDFNIVNENGRSKKLDMDGGVSIPQHVLVHPNHYPKEIKLIGYQPVDPFDPFNSANFSEVFSTRYTVTMAELEYEYSISNIKCSMVKYNDTTIWQKSPESNIYPISMKLVRLKNVILLRFADYFIKLILKDNEWESKKYNYEKKEPEDETIGAVGGESDPAVYLSPEELDNFSKCKKIDIDLEKSIGNDYIQRCEDIETSNGFFLAKEGNVLNSIVCSNELIWQAGEGEYCKEVFVDDLLVSSCRYVSVKLVDGTYNHFTKTGNKWTKTQNGIVFDLKAEESTFLYRCEIDGDIKIFTRKLNFIFISVRYNENMIWEGNPNENSSKIVLKGKGKKKKYIILLINNENFILFHKSGKKQPWENITHTRHRMNDIKLFKSDGTEIDKSEYNVDLLKTSFSYIFKPQVECYTVKYNEQTVWNYNDTERNKRYPTSINLELTTNELILKFDYNIEKKLNIT